MVTTETQKPTYEELLIENERLKAELANLRRLIFGQKRERFVPIQNQDQLIFFNFAEAPKSQPAVTEQIVYTRKKHSHKHTPHGRNEIPAHLPRKDIFIEPEEDVTGLKRIGQEITEELEYEPGKLYVNRYIRPKYALPKDEGIIIGSLPSRPIEKCIAGPGLQAHIMISKYVDHIPLYRQRQQYRRQGIEMAESTMCGWMKYDYNLLLPLYDLQKVHVLRAIYLMADETTIRVLEKLYLGTSHQGYYWIYYDPLGKEGFFDYRQSRSRAGPNEILQNFEGYLQSDGYVGYGDVNSRKTVIGLGCMAHARRYFVEAQLSDKTRSEWMLCRIQDLYRIERQARDEALSFQARYELRQTHSIPILNDIKNWLDKECIRVLPRSAIGKAIGYMLGQWQRLNVYTTDGRLEIDNNLVENAIRPIALGRKNYLFAGSHEGAKRAALIYTLVANAKLQGHDPFAYLKDVLIRISDHPYKQLDQLLPCNWKSKS